MAHFIELLIHISACLLEVAGEEIPSMVWDLLTSEWAGFLGASTVLVLSLGMIRWENNDWRARLCGRLMIIGMFLEVLHFAVRHPSVPS